MHDIFSPQRFWWLLKKTVIERTLLIFGLVILSLVGTWFLYHTSVLDISQSGIMRWESYNQASTMGTSLILSLSILVSVLFSSFSNSARGISYLTLPASNLEKWLSGATFTILYMSLFFAFFRHHLDLQTNEYMREQLLNL